MSTKEKMRSSQHVHHVEEHQAGMVVFFFLGEFFKSVLSVEVNSRKIGINGKEAEGRLVLPRIKSFFQLVHQPAADVLPTVIP